MLNVKHVHKKCSTCSLKKNKFFLYIFIGTETNMLLKSRSKAMSQSKPTDGRGRDKIQRSLSAVLYQFTKTANNEKILRQKINGDNSKYTVRKESRFELGRILLK